MSPTFGNLRVCTGERVVANLLTSAEIPDKIRNRQYEL
mgnify:CR=1 FL=1